MESPLSSRSIAGRRPLPGAFVTAAALLLAVAATAGATPAGPRARGQQPNSGEPAAMAFAELRQRRGPFLAEVPRPESVLGFAPGTDFRLADWPAILAYLEALDGASDRIVLERIGESAEGQPLVLAIISSPENLRERERYRRIARRLALAEQVAEADARRLAREGKAVVWIDSGLHATEVAHGQHAPELAWIMVASENPEIRRIREEVILLLMPNMNPDGLNIVARWYRDNLGTPFETAPLPVLYHKYVGHDNNRDWYMLTQPETRAVTRQLYREWFPQIVYNHHQSAPFPARIFVPPFDEPANPNIPPLVLRGITRVGNAISTRLEAEGKAGAVSRLGFTAWWNGGMRTVPYFHNMVGILTETALYRYATPRFYAPDELPDTFRDGTSTREPSMKYPLPWPGGWWRLRDPIEYMLTASIATLDVAARDRQEWLLNIWRMGHEEIERGRAGHPAAWLLPPGQRDPGATARLLELLQRGGLRVERAVTEFTVDDRLYEAGTFVVPAAQAFRRYAVDLLEPQRYPDRRLYPGGPPQPPYDLAGWTLPLQMGVRVDRAEAPFEAATEPLSERWRPQGAVVGRGSSYVIDPRPNASIRAATRLLEGGATVYRLAEAVDADGERYPPGALVVPGEPGTAGRLSAIAEQEGLRVRAVSRRPRGRAWRLRMPRVAVYEPWVANIDAGWTRFLLEQYGFPYRVLRDARVRKGGLRAEFDVIVLPSAGLRALVQGHPAGRMPAAYVGGLGDRGVEALERFVRAGGTLVALDAAAALPIERFALPVENVLADVPQKEFFCPGSLLRIGVDTSHPVAYGLPEEATAFFVRSPAFAVAEEAGEAVATVASYPDGGLLESGWILGEEKLRGRGAVLEVPHGRGRVLLLGFRVQFRAQPHETFKLLFNSLLYAAASAEELR